MGAREKLNTSYFGVAVIVALAIGWIFQSIALAATAFVGLVATMIYDGNIRPKNIRRRRN